MIFALRGQAGVCGLLTADDIVIVQVNTCRGSEFKYLESIVQSYGQCTRQVEWV